MKIKLGTRASKLARAQTALVAQALTDAGIEVEETAMVSDGDRTRASLASLGGTGVFAANLRRALIAGECDAVVHSLKDLPAAGHPQLRIAAMPTRANPADVLCAREDYTLMTLPAGAVIATGSPRRAAQIRARRQDVVTCDIRGNIHTRLSKVGTEVDAVVLAAAGLERAGMRDAISQYLPLDEHPCSGGQGILAVEVRRSEDRAELLAALSGIEDPAARAAGTAERALLRQVEAGCAAPLGVYARVGGDELHIHVAAYSPDGTGSVHLDATGPVADADQIGTELGGRLAQTEAREWIPRLS